MLARGKIWTACCAILVMAAYLVGGCLACGQMLQASAQNSGCCHANKCSRSQHSGHQNPQPSPQRMCEGSWLPSTVASPSPAPELMLQAAAHPAAFLAAPALQTDQDHRLASSPPHAPPRDLPILHAALLI